MSKFGMGQPMRRVEDPRLLTGTGTYLDDVKVDGCMQAVFVRSPLAHAEIVSVDLEEAKTAPGVIAIYTIADLDAAGVGPVAARARAQNIDGSDMVLPERPVLARGRVRHVGDPVVCVVAETLAQARDAAELVEIDYDDLPVIADTADAIEPDAPQIWDVAPNNTSFHWGMGDKSATDAAFANAHRVIELELINNRVSANPMETRGALAAPDPETGKTKVWLSSQGVFSLHNELAAVLNIDKSELRVVTTDVGGGFGMKIFNYPEYVAVTFATRALGRPVRWVSDRTEALISDDHARDVVTVAKLALDAEHRFLGLRVDSVANLGAYVSQYAAFVATSAGCTMIPGVYAIPVSYVTVKGAFTNTNPVDAYRGAGRPEAAYMIERLVDKTARELGIPTDELRRRNFIPAAAMPYTTCTGLVYDSGDFNDTLTKGQQLADWDGFAARAAASRAAGKLRGRGLAYYVEICSGGGAEQATIEMAGNGKITVLIGSQSNGQGHETAFTQLVCETLGVDPDQVAVVQGDSERISYGTGTGGSRSVPVGGGALVNSAQQVIETAKQKASEMLETTVADLEFADSRFTVVGTDRSVSLVEVAAASAGSPDGLAFNETARWAPPEGAGTFPNGAHIVEIEIDMETGAPFIDRYTICDDFGRVVNPLLLLGQIHGGVAQGIGQALYEEAVFDSDSGQLLTGSFMDYAMPRADQIPSLTIKFNNIPCTTNLLGIKGAGEAGTIGATPAVINAVVDALADHCGISHIDMPATQLSIWRLLQASKRAQAAE